MYTISVTHATIRPLSNGELGYHAVVLQEKDHKHQYTEAYDPTYMGVIEKLAAQLGVTELAALPTIER